MGKNKGKVAAEAFCRLGNQMFIAAACATFAKRTGREFIGLTKHESGDYPEWQLNTILRNVPYIDRKLVEGFKAFEGYDGKEKEWNQNGFPETDEPNIFFQAFLQDARCIEKDVAYDLFKPYPSILKTIYNLYGDLRDMVCVNVRRGDYLMVMPLGFNVYTRDELDSIINQFFPNDNILFVSDDIQWCKDNFHGDKYTFADKPYEHKAEIDLYIQTQCKANIIANSTFSWWGAFLNEHAEKVVCHWPWMRRGCRFENPEFILPDNWIKFEFYE